MGIATNLYGDVAPQTAQGDEVLALHRLCQFPPHMKLGRPFRRAAATFNHEGGRSEVAGNMLELGGNVASIKVNNNGLHLQNICGTGLSLLGNYY